ncbi:MAG: hypothetical protein A3C62_02005 [Candidatus Zambryskibacteria bacterium RIFCSPHIGHO2_02_FULL_39_16]|nr:MAG: hypothetical protein A3C62_02005 [Candidatus Zambryskibacteria bacterium RIFCSPHIGHO2_02_FULL_39_16]
MKSSAWYYNISNMKNQRDIKKQIEVLPDAPGVYYFIGPKLSANSYKLKAKDSRRILYIGKATSLKDRVRSYFVRDILMTRSPLIAKMLEEAEKVEFVQKDSVLEALIMEANEIKKYQPIYNSKEKDDKSYNYVTITKEDFPKIIITRSSGTYGPFPHGAELRQALKIIRKIFSYRDEKCKLTGKPCFNAQIGLCPGPCARRISKKDYNKIIRRIKLFFEGKKDTLIRSLELDMKKFAKEQKFEEAEQVKRKLFALDHIQDIALIRNDLVARSYKPGANFRIEAYDVAHISGKNVVGVMTVVSDGELDKSQYRKFKIKSDNPFVDKQGNNDTKNLKEILSRRLSHPEWKFPNLIVVDGGKGQINTARKVLIELGLEMIDVVSVVKDERHRAREILGLRDSTLDRSILLANAEAHRFAIGFHRKLRNKGFRI